MASPCPETLIVDSDRTLRRALVASLIESGFRVREASCGEEALAAMLHQRAGLILLALDRPVTKGLEVCRWMRAYDKQAGIVMLSGGHSEDDKVTAFEAGADDFVSKPFRFRELVARLRAIHRRQQRHDAPPGPAVFRVGPLELDMGGRRLTKAGVEIRLTPKEFGVLAVLVKNLGTPVTHRKLLQSVWGPDHAGQTEYLRSYVKMLRKKIEDDPSRPQYILTDPWSGYRFAAAHRFGAH